MEERFQHLRKSITEKHNLEESELSPLHIPGQVPMIMMWIYLYMFPLKHLSLSLFLSFFFFTLCLSLTLFLSFFSLYTHTHLDFWSCSRSCIFCWNCFPSNTQTLTLTLIQSLFFPIFLFFSSSLFLSPFFSLAQLIIALRKRLLELAWFVVKMAKNWVQRELSCKDHEKVVKEFGWT